MRASDPGTYAEAEEHALTTQKLFGALRIGLTIVMMIFVGLIYCLHYVKPGDAEYYISIITLVLNGVLLAAMLTAAFLLKRKQKLYRELMEKYRREDKPDPWILSGEQRRQ